MDKEQDNSYHKINLNWYPGHMAKTKKQILEDLKLVDIVVEILDARIPRASQNPDLQQWIKGKKKIFLLNKSDLAEEKKNQMWIEYYKKQGIPAILVEANTGKGISEVIQQIEKIASSQKQEIEQKGRKGRSIRVMVVGIPNVGKSSFINRMTKKASATVGNKPGVTKQKQWIHVKENIALLDTPGILWPKLEPEQTALHLAYVGSIKEENLEKIEIAYHLLKYLLQEKRQNLVERYGIQKEEIENILQHSEKLENEKIMEILYRIGKKRGAIKAGGYVDEEKVASFLLEEFRNGKLGRITLEIPEEEEKKK